LRAKLPQQSVPVFNAIVTGSSKHLAATMKELKDLEETQNQMRAAGITSLGDMPVIVLRHGAGQPMMASPEVVRALEDTFERLQGEMAALSTNGQVIVAERSGHAIHLDQPELVVEAINAVVSSTRAPEKRRSMKSPSAIP
jgi:hypothetical protein